MGEDSSTARQRGENDKLAKKELKRKGVVRTRRGKERLAVAKMGGRMKWGVRWLIMLQRLPMRRKG